MPPLQITGNGTGPGVNAQVSSLGVGVAPNGAAGRIDLSNLNGLVALLAAELQPVADGTLSIGDATHRLATLWGKALIRQIQNLVSGATPAVDATLGDHCFLSILTNIAVVVAAPTNPPAAGHKQRLTFEIKNGTAGALTTPPAFAAAYKVTSALPALAAGQRYLIAFVYSPDAAAWVQDSVAPFVY